MILILKWQGYREFWVNCIVQIHGSILNMPQAINTPRLLRVSIILIC